METIKEAIAKINNTKLIGFDAKIVDGDDGVCFVEVSAFSEDLQRQYSLLINLQQTIKNNTDIILRPDTWGNILDGRMVFGWELEIEKEQKINNTSRIKALEAQGFKVEITHFRVLDVFDWLTGKINKHLDLYIKGSWGDNLVLFDSNNVHLNQFGGRTLIHLKDLDGNEYFFESNCSKEDRFCYRTGVSVALDRVEKELESFLNK